MDIILPLVGTLVMLLVLMFIIFLTTRSTGLYIESLSDSNYIDAINEKNVFSRDIERIGKDVMIIKDPQIGLIEIKKSQTKEGEQTEEITVFQVRLKFFLNNGKKMKYKVFEVLNSLKDNDSLELSDPEILNASDNDSLELNDLDMLDEIDNQLSPNKKSHQK